jgi:drug/metabolite transporter (DMT)-like permease
VSWLPFGERACVSPWPPSFGFFYFALTQIQAGLGQTLLALVPLATLLLAVAQRQERLSAAAVLGTLLGLAGIALISLDPGREPVPPIALLAVLLSVLCFAQALVLVRRLPPMQPVTLNAVGMVAGALALLAAALLLGEPMVLPQRAETWVALLYVVAIGSVVVFLLHVFVAQHWGASRAAYVMVVIPLVTITLSTWLDRRPVARRPSCPWRRLPWRAAVYTGAPLPGRRLPGILRPGIIAWAY